MNEPYAPRERLEARLEQLTARVDELSRTPLDLGRPIDSPRAIRLQEVHS